MSCDRGKQRGNLQYVFFNHKKQKRKENGQNNNNTIRSVFRYRQWDFDGLKIPKKSGINPHHSQMQTCQTLVRRPGLKMTCMPVEFTGKKKGRKVLIPNRFHEKNSIPKIFFSRKKKNMVEVAFFH